MMRRLPLLMLAAVACLAGGCFLQTLHPLFASKDYIPYPELVGTWVQVEKQQILLKTEERKSFWTFEKDDRRYKLTHTDEYGKKAIFKVAVGRIGTNIFLCSELDDPTSGSGMNLFAAVHSVPIFAFAKVRKTEAGLSFVLMDLQWFAGQMEKNPQFVPYVIRPNGEGDRWPLVTASTEELQKFVAKYADDDKAFSVEIKLVRQPAK